jgi:ubiquinone/menaquinone biosynthesis C-methylase UbiE
MSPRPDLDDFYGRYPRIEERFRAALDIGLEARGPEMLYDLVAGFGLGPGAMAIDVGCGEGRHSIALAERFGLRVAGIDPVDRNINLANRTLADAVSHAPELTARVSFDVGSAELLPGPDQAVDLVWCRDVLLHVADLAAAYSEIHRVLRVGGRAIVYQSCFATDRLEPKEADWLFGALRITASSTDPRHHESAIDAAHLQIDDQEAVGLEWAERAEEQDRLGDPWLLRATRLLRAPDRYVAEFGLPAYDIMLADVLWHVYRAIGKLGARVYVLSRQH